MLGLIKETSICDRSLYLQNLEIIQQLIDLPAQQRKLKLDQLHKGEDSLLNAINAQTTYIKSNIMLMSVYKCILKPLLIKISKLSLNFFISINE